MNYQLCPVIVMNGECNVPDAVLVQIWAKILNEGKYHDLFYDGGIQTYEEWLEFIKSPLNYPVIVFEGETLHAIAWLNYTERVSARCHFVVFGHYLRGIGETIINYWKGMKGSNGQQLIHVLIGITPEDNGKMKKLMRLIGFNILGTIPHFCYIAKENRMSGACVGYLDLKEA